MVMDTEILGNFCPNPIQQIPGVCRKHLFLSLIFILKKSIFMRNELDSNSNEKGFKGYTQITKIGKAVPVCIAVGN